MSVPQMLRSRELMMVLGVYAAATCVSRPGFVHRGSVVGQVVGLLNESKGHWQAPL